MERNSEDIFRNLERQLELINLMPVKDTAHGLVDIPKLLLPSQLPIYNEKVANGLTVGEGTKLKEALELIEQAPFGEIVEIKLTILEKTQEELDQIVATLSTKKEGLEEKGPKAKSK